MRRAARRSRRRCCSAPSARPRPTAARRARWETRAPPLRTARRTRLLAHPRPLPSPLPAPPRDQIAAWKAGHKHKCGARAGQSAAAAQLRRAARGGARVDAARATAGPTAEQNRLGARERVLSALGTSPRHDGEMGNIASRLQSLGIPDWMVEGFITLAKVGDLHNRQDFNGIIALEDDLLGYVAKLQSDTQPASVSTEMAVFQIYMNLGNAYYFRSLPDLFISDQSEQARVASETSMASAEGYLDKCMSIYDRGSQRRMQEAHSVLAQSSPETLGSEHFDPTWHRGVKRSREYAHIHTYKDTCLRTKMLLYAHVYVYMRSCTGC